jgi:hypothetical protein
MRRIFVHRSPELRLEMTVEFEKGELPGPSQCVVHFCAGRHTDQVKATREFARWIKHVRNILKKEGAKIT